MYLGDCLLYAGMGLLVPHPLSTLLVAIGFTALVLQARAEDVHMAALFGEPFRCWQQRSGLLLFQVFAGAILVLAVFNSTVACKEPGQRVRPKTEAGRLGAYFVQSVRHRGEVLADGRDVLRVRPITVGQAAVRAARGCRR